MKITTKETMVAQRAEKNPMVNQQTEIRFVQFENKKSTKSSNGINSSECESNESECIKPNKRTHELKIAHKREERKKLNATKKKQSTHINWYQVLNATTSSQ